MRPTHQPLPRSMYAYYDLLIEQARGSDRVTVREWFRVMRRFDLLQRPQSLMDVRYFIERGTWPERRPMLDFPIEWLQ